MNIYQKLAYQTAKQICKSTDDERINNPKNIIITYKARLQDARKRKASIEDMKKDLRFVIFLNTHEFVYNEVLKCSKWIEKDNK